MVRTRSMTTSIAFLALVLLGRSAVAEDTPGLAGRWDLGEGRDNLVHDSSGGANDGLAEGVQWVELESASAETHYALEFLNVRGHVNCGNGSSLDITGPITLEAWVFPSAPAPAETGICGKSFDSYGMTLYTDGRAYWYIGSGGNKCSAPLKTRHWSHVAGTFDGTFMKLYIDGQLADTTQSTFTSVPHGGAFLIGCIDKGRHTDSFRGLIGSVRVYHRALAPKEIQTRFESEFRYYPGPPAKYEQIMASPFFYLDKGQVLLDVDLCAVYPLKDHEHAWAELRVAGAPEPLQRYPLPSIPRSGLLRDVAIEVGRLAPADYDLRVAVGSPGHVRSQWRTAFEYPAKRELPSPTAHRVPPLPAPPVPPHFDLALSESGGCTLLINGQRYPVESTYSYPGGGANALAVADSPSVETEPVWTVEAGQRDANTYHVTASGAYYRIERTIERSARRILVKDTITNTTGAALGILLSNHLTLSEKHGFQETLLPNPSAFLGKKGLGLGLVALDDVYLEHYSTFCEDGSWGIRDGLFGLDAAASYTLEWAVYLNSTGDYYDFVNAVRKDQGYCPTVEGGFAFTDRREPPSEEYVHARALRYASIGCLGNVPDDPGLSLEGVEFIAYPQECTLLKETFAETRRRYPEMKVMFHIAHSLYTTNRPEQVFPDARVLDATGTQTDYGRQNPAYYEKYFSKERVAEGYRWYIFYPTMDNSFGKYMLNAIDYMLDELGVNGMFADGFTHGYGGRFTYDRWDKHTVAIDPETKSIRRKFASVNLMAQDVLIETARRVEAAGGVVIANSYPGTRSLHQENVLYCLETAGGGKVCSRLYFTPSVIALGNPANLVSGRDVYEDILDKLKWGALYFYYGEKKVSLDNIVTRMYPITVEAIHAGIIRGKERIITMKSGTYGWQGDTALHRTYAFDGRGEPFPHHFNSTGDSTGCRTAIELSENQSAVIERIPVHLQAEAPVNVRVEAYDESGLQLRLHANTRGSFTVHDGVFAIEPGEDYVIQVGQEERILTAQDKAPSFAFELTGSASVRIERFRGARVSRPLSPPKAP